MKEWIEVIRDKDFFNLAALNVDDISTSLSFDIRTHRGPINVQYDSVRGIKNAAMPNPPNYIAMSDVHSYATQDSTIGNLKPHAASPAAAQRAASIAFVWGDLQRGGSIHPYREDGFPAVIIASSLSKYYQHGVMTRNRQHPAIKAEYLAALWYTKREEPDCYRNNGPAAIVFENYKEFWVDDEYKGNRWTDITQDWNHRPADGLDDFLDNLKGTTNLFSNVYFDNQVDEVCYITDYA